MRPEDVYKIGPGQVSTEMIDTTCSFLKSILGRDPTFDENITLAELMLKTAKHYYRLGAFHMEHREGQKCQAEDQGGWPCCGAPAEFFVERKHLRSDERRVYCSEHRKWNRFFRADQMAPIYESPSGKKEG